MQSSKCKDAQRSRILAGADRDKSQIDLNMYLEQVSVELATKKAVMEFKDH